MPRQLPNVTRLGTLAALPLAVLAGLGVKVSAWREPAPKSAPAASERRAAGERLGGMRPYQSPFSGELTEVTTESTPSAQERERIDAELVTLRPAGFEPAEISRAGGRFLLAVNNRSGLEGLTLRLATESGARERDVNLGRRLRWRERLNLSPGDYALTVAGRPDWTCRITITE